MKASTRFCAILTTFLFTASLSSAEILGNELRPRPTTDGDSGAVYIYGTETFSGPGSATAFSFFPNIAGRHVTPLLLELVSGPIDNNDAVYTITGIGESIAAIANGMSKTPAEGSRLRCLAPSLAVRMGFVRAGVPPHQADQFVGICDSAISGICRLGMIHNSIVASGHQLPH